MQLLAEPFKLDPNFDYDNILCHPVLDGIAPETRAEILDFCLIPTAGIIDISLMDLESPDDK